MGLKKLAGGIKKIKRERNNFSPSTFVDYYLSYTYN